MFPTYYLLKKLRKLYKISLKPFSLRQLWSNEYLKGIYLESWHCDIVSDEWSELLNCSRGNMFNTTSLCVNPYSWEQTIPCSYLPCITLTLECEDLYLTWVIVGGWFLYGGMGCEFFTLEVTTGLRRNAWRGKMKKWRHLDLTKKLNITYKTVNHEPTFLLLHLPNIYKLIK